MTEKLFTGTLNHNQNKTKTRRRNKVRICGYLIISDNFAYFFIKTYVVGAHLHRLAEAILMSTHKIGFYEDLTKLFFELSSNMHLISSAANMLCI